MCKTASVVLAAIAMSSASELVSSKTYGFVGTGTMSSAIVRGLATLNTPPAAILVSPRNAEKAAALCEAFPGLVTVAADNQAVLDGSEVVFIGVLPTITEETCRALSFKPTHMVVSLVSTAPLDGLRAWCAPVPHDSVVRAIPLPPVAKHKGATILTPPHALVTAIFDSLGTAIPVETETVMRKMLPVTGLMGQFYAMQRATQAWVVGQGVPAEDAAKYVGAIFHCITYDTAEAGVETFDHLVKEQTPGGINEQVRTQKEIVRGNTHREGGKGRECAEAPGALQARSIRLSVNHGLSIDPFQMSRRQDALRRRTGGCCVGTRQSTNRLQALSAPPARTPAASAVR